MRRRIDLLITCLAGFAAIFGGCSNYSTDIPPGTEVLATQACKDRQGLEAFTYERRNPTFTKLNTKLVIACKDKSVVTLEFRQ